MTSAQATTVQLAERRPRLTGEEMLASLVPPPQFRGATFETYRADDAYPSQQESKELLQRFATHGSAPLARGGLFSFGRKNKRPAEMKPGVYLDGGFGVGKTHLLASLYHAGRAQGIPGDRLAFGTFVEYTNLVGALSFRRTVEVLSSYDLVCIDEFELDDAGDTTLMSRLLRELADAGVKLAATSNTLPGALGDGRFAADDFKREIQVLADQFRVVRVDGEDYRHRGLAEAPPPLADAAVEEFAAEHFGDQQVVVDDFTALCDHLASVHPSRYRQLLTDVDVLVLKDVETITAQALALRFVVLADRLYDQDVKIVASGVAFDQLFTDEMMSGGYMKKYHRAVSRLTALVRSGQMGEQAL